MSAWLAQLGPDGALLAMLVLGHMLGDFVLQTEAMVQAKDRLPVLALHATIVTAATAVALAPWLSGPTLLVLLVVGLSHLVIDAAKQRANQALDAPVVVFLADQIAHLAVLVAAWIWLMIPGWASVPSLPGIGTLNFVTLAWMTHGAVVASALAFNHHGANAIVRGLLPGTFQDDDRPLVRAGRIIGTLERYLVLLLSIFGQWGAIALVLAAKSIARFEELKDKPFAEYYLIGTLSSMLIAVVSGIVVQALI